MQDFSYTSASARGRSGLFNINGSNCSQSQPWTAARCNRLLRALKSRVEILRKECSTLQSANLPTSNMMLLEQNITSTRRHQKLRDHEDETGHRGGVKKRVRITYAGRSKTKDDPHSQIIVSRPGRGHIAKEKGNRAAVLATPGEISVPTPLLVRTKYDPVIAEDVSEFRTTRASIPLIKGKIPGHFHKHGETYLRSKDKLRQLRGALTHEKYVLHIGIYNALDSLLKATAMVSSDTMKTSTSLISMCLRQLPRRIKREEIWDQEYMENQGLKSALDIHDISGDFYAELEALSSGPCGWKHLKDIVRAHGVQVVSDALVDGLISPEFGDALVMLCSQTASHNEAESLIASLFHGRTFPGPTSLQGQFADIPSMSPFSILDQFVTTTGRTDAYFQQLSELFSKGALSITWLATKHFGSLWTRFFRSISMSITCREACLFAETVLPLMAQSNEQLAIGSHGILHTEVSSALHTTFNSVLATLSSIAILNGDSIITAVDADQKQQRHNYVFSLIKSVVVGCKLCSTTLSNQRTTLLAMGAMLATPFRYYIRPGMMEILQQYLNNTTTADISNISRFICSVAQCCGRGTSSNGFEHLKLIIANLELWIPLMHPSTSSLLAEVIVDSIHIFARLLPNATHLDYAKHIAITFQCHHKQRLQASDSNREGPPTIGFRWEEGIGEWVTATPLICSKGQIGFSGSPRREDSDIDTPFQPRFKRFKVVMSSAPTREGPLCTLKPLKRLSDLVPSSPHIGVLESSESEGDGCSQTDLRPNTRPLSSFVGRKLAKTSRAKSVDLAKSKKIVCRPSHKLERALETDDSLSSSGADILRREIFAELLNVRGKEVRSKMQASRVDESNRVGYSSFSEDSGDELGL
jgi:hypothetical protein